MLPADASRSSSSSRSSRISSTSASDSEASGSTSSTETTSRLDPRIISDAIIGLSDGLTVPFALTAGLSTLSSTRVVIFAGLAELTAGAISMGLGGYLAAKSEEESYKATLNDTRRAVACGFVDAVTSIKEVFEPYDLPPALSEDLAYHLSKSPTLVQFLMQFQHNTPEPAATRAITSGLTIACGYFLGGLLPLLPYFMVGQDEVMLALRWSFVFMAVSLFAFGYSKTCFVSGWRGGKNVWAGSRAGLQMMLVGGAAATCAMSLVQAFDSLAS
ncbi:hypothetical protein DOTSEDRAFT_87891 [Dothistroma septosporum NZE10]|uniref:Vacuolar iron transporter Ccc1 n=1 Tax=Dothistroma septosporum (strain NZE10 / CBS 128990) TaxID=675120 RepID=N1PT35_DOTSN|nr:hypothetical protein DOTSEDRAFT_87891 [Dothistroma septosporum NZE10]